ncbi:SPOR domain-containing protein [Halovulum marinum]|uniref:SPOR domain-containing protein n=1 Tax=Halovulum marinum TaxID=2662447 RepID=UPI001F382D0B|nr:SPOR domain-containing protein [Halovulum marinum]
MTAALGGCGRLDGLGDATGAAAASASGAPAAPAQNVRVQERDIERPDIFALEAKGLWDGRFSFGDKWVAVAANVKAERVRIVNQANGRAIEGALFQKEDNLPGPPIMVSQNAAEALAMLPGTLTDMKIVVLRREVVPVQPDPAAAPTPAVAAGQVFSVDGVSTAAIPGTVAPAPAAPAPVPAAAPAHAGIDTAALETTALAAVEAAATPPAATAPAAAPAVSASGTWIQVVNGGNRDGAELTLKRLKDNGLNGEIRRHGSDSAPMFRVVAGPFAGGAAFNTALAKIKGLGYRDAFAAR